MNDHASPSEQTAPSGIRVGVCDAGTSLPSVERALDFVSDPGFGGIAVASAGIAKILFFIFLALFVIALLARALRGTPPV